MSEYIQIIKAFLTKDGWKEDGTPVCEEWKNSEYPNELIRITYKSSSTEISTFKDEDQFFDEVIAKEETFIVGSFASRRPNPKEVKTEAGKKLLTILTCTDADALNIELANVNQ